ncbi:MAG: glycosyltransferase family 39 protein [Chloroflexota bacterium]
MANNTLSTTGNEGAVQTLSREAESVWARHRTAIVMWAITILAAGLRLFGATANGYRLDEVWSIWIGKQSLPDMVGNFLFDNLDSTPPTYYALLHPFLALSEDYLVVRLLTIIAGTLMVLVTFRLALYLFDLPVAALSAFLLAVAPLHIEYSQVARAYVLTGLLATLSIYFCARVLLGEGTRWHWIWLVVTSALMLYTHYLAGLVIVFENLFVAALWLRHGLAKPVRNRWILSQVITFLGALPLIATSLYGITHMQQGRGIAWLSRPDLQVMIKSAILFTTGDPSYGPTGVTIQRGLSLATIAAIGLLGLWLFARHIYRRKGDEGKRVLFIAGALLVPLAIALGVSQFRSIYHEKYLLFVMPPLMILVAWVLVRSLQRSVISPAMPVAVALICLTSVAGYIYYTAPAGEQWREAVAYVRAGYHPGDVVLMSPGYYGRPFSYYFTGTFPEDMRTLGYTDVVEFKDGQYTGLKLGDQGEQILASNTQLDSAQRIWLLSGYVADDKSLEKWLGQNFTVVKQADYLGTHVRELESVKR